MRAPKLVVLMGIPGSGKTSVARWLESNMSFAVVSRDIIRAAMFRRCRYTLDEKNAAFRAMLDALTVTLSLGQDACTDGHTFSSRDDLALVLDVARKTEADPLLVHCVCPVEIAQRRVEFDLINDPDAPPDRDAALVTSVAERFHAPPEWAIRIDTTESVQASGETIKRLLAVP